MRLLVLVALLLSITACSKALKVTIFNASEAQIQACSFDSDQRNLCIEVAPGTFRTLEWTTGKVKITRSGCVAIYTIPRIKAWKDYFDESTEAIRLALSTQLKLLIVKNGQAFGDVNLSAQPSGFPADADDIPHCS